MLPYWIDFDGYSAFIWFVLFMGILWYIVNPILTRATLPWWDEPGELE